MGLPLILLACTSRQAMTYMTIMESTRFKYIPLTLPSTLSIALSYLIGEALIEVFSLSTQAQVLKDGKVRMTLRPAKNLQLVVPL